MGQQHSTEIDRLQEIRGRLILEAKQRMNDLEPAATAEKAEGIPAAHGSQQALFAAAVLHFMQLLNESCAIDDRLAALNRSRHGAPEMPEPTPRWEEVEASLTVAEPSTPEGGSGPALRQRGSSPVRMQRGSSSDEAAAPPGNVQLSKEGAMPDAETTLLLPGASSSLGLRRRPRA